jgi:hypothetical protein
MNGAFCVTNAMAKVIILKAIIMKTEYLKLVDYGVLVCIVRFRDGKDHVTLYGQGSSHRGTCLKIEDEFFAEYIPATEAEFEELREKSIEKLLAL